jgi:hypothetical protein
MAVGCPVSQVSNTGRALRVPGNGRVLGGDEQMIFLDPSLIIKIVDLTFFNHL